MTLSQRRPAVPLLEGESVLLGDDEVVEDTEIDVGAASPSQPPEGVEGLLPVEEVQAVAQTLRREGHLVRGHLVRMVPQGHAGGPSGCWRSYRSGQPGATSAEAAGSSARRYCSRRRRTFPEDRSLDPGQEAAVLGEEADADAVLRAKAHQERAARDVPEADDAPDRVDGETEAGLLLDLDDDRFPLLGKVGALRRDEKGIQVLLHGFSVMCVMSFLLLS